MLAEKKGIEVEDVLSYAVEKLVLPAIDGSEDVVLVQEREFIAYTVPADVVYANKLMS